MSGHSWVVKIDGTNVAGLVLVGAQINYGRRTVAEQPAPSSGIFTLLTPDAAASIAERFPDFGPGDFAARSGFTDAYEDTYSGVSSRLTIGAPITVDAITASGFTDSYDDSYTGSQLRRFTGRITALEYAYGSVRVTAVDPLEQLGRIKVDGARPAETDIERATFAAQAAGFELIIDGTIGEQLMPITQSSQVSTLAMLYAAAKETGAIVYSDRWGELHYRTRDAAENPPTTLPSGETILDSIGMKAELGEVINSIDVEYGDKKTVSAYNPESMSRYGVFTSKISSQLAEQSAAQGLADRMIELHALPLYSMPSVTVTLIKDNPATIDQLGSLDLADFVHIKDLPVGAPAQEYTARVLGYSEELAFPDWLITYQLAPSSFVEERLYA
jgi:hypothetical protein